MNHISNFNIQSSQEYSSRWDWSRVLSSLCYTADSCICYQGNTVIYPEQALRLIWNVFFPLLPAAEVKHSNFFSQPPQLRNIHARAVCHNCSTHLDMNEMRPTMVKSVKLRSERPGSFLGDLGPFPHSQPNLPQPNISHMQTWFLSHTLHGVAFENVLETSVGPKCGTLGPYGDQLERTY